MATALAHGLGISGQRSWDPSLEEDCFLNFVDDYTVGVWNNNCSVGGSVAQSTPSLQPSASTLNGLVCPLWDNTDDTMVIDGVTLTSTALRPLHDGSGCTLIAVINSSNDGRIIDSQRLSNTRIGIELYYIGQAFGLVVANGGGVAFTINHTTGGVYTYGATYCVVYRYLEGRAGNEWNLRVNGVSAASGDSLSAPSALDATYPLRVGNRANTGGDPLGGKIAHLSAYSSYKTDDWLAAVAEPYAARWTP